MRREVRREASSPAWSERLHGSYRSHHKDSSYAYGYPSANSDVDLLVILPFCGNPVSKAIEIRSRFDTAFPLDLIARNPAFINQRLKERDMFIELIMTRGRIMYEGQHS